jgi:hypothetical protein
MTQHSDDLVMVAAGGLIEVRAWADVLQGAGIMYRVVGDDLTAGLGTALPDSVELWVFRTDAEAAEAEMAARFHNSLDDALLPKVDQPATGPAG